MIAFEGPFVLNRGERSAVVRGWCNDVEAPVNVRITLDNFDLPVTLTPAPQVDRVFPHLKAVTYEAPVDFVDVYQRQPVSYMKDLFSVVFMISTPSEERGFEVAATQEWADGVFGASRAPRVKPPTPPHLMVRVAGSSEASFYPSGRKAVAEMKSLLIECKYRLSDFHRVLDFGCGCGRILVNVAREMPSCQLFGTDVDAEAIAWCQQNLFPAGTFDANGTLPPLRYESDMFDLIYGVSVFTHLPEDHQFAWLAELQRILKPGGLLITTILGPQMQEALPVELRKTLGRNGFVYVDDTKPDWPWYLGAKTDGLPDSYRLAYHSHEYVKRAWSDHLDIVLIKEQGLNFGQDAVVCRKRTRTFDPSSLLSRLWGRRRE